MSSAAQIHANQRNSQSSTGPCSPTGKARSSQNAFRHGLASNQVIIPGESATEFDAFLQGLFADHQPANIIETILIQNMAMHHWLKLRAIHLQSYPECTPAQSNALVRYQTTNERSFWKAYDTLRKLQKERAEAEAAAAAEPEIGFVPQPEPTPEPAASPEPSPAPPQPTSIWKKHPGLGSLPPSRKRKRY